GTSPDDNIDTLRINIEGLKFNSESLGLAKESEIGSKDGDTGPTREEIAQKLGTIDNSLTRIAGERATLGAIQNRLGSAISNLNISTENQTAAMSRIKDVDFAEETSK